MSALPALVTADWLAEELGKPDLRVLDASYYLPAENIDAHARFAAGHIPGAQFFDIEEVADTETDLPHMLPTPGRFARLAAALGVDSADRVVVYDQKGIFSAPRAWWMFRLFGHDRVAVLDGGLPAWRDGGHALEAGPPAVVAPARFVADFYATRVRGLGDMRRNLATRAELVLDARSAGRFSGADPEPRAGLPSGHIPGAVSVPAHELVQSGHMRPAEALRARFAAAGVDGSRPIVTSCGSGVSAAILTLGLHLADLPEGALYDGSWTEWAQRPETPKATGLE
ncbi:MAG: 3-mercaptopyruvate sulfurtransferase [Rhodospirillales bacterium]